MERVEDIFIGGLVAAGQCREHRRAENSRQARQRHGLGHTRSIHTASSKRGAAAAAVEQIEKPQISRDQYRKLADFYPEYDPSEEIRLREEQQLAKRQRHMPLAPRLFLTAEQEAMPPYTKRQVLPPEDKRHAKQIAALKRLLKTKAGRLNLDTLWQHYQDLRSPRPRYLEDKTLWYMLRHLGWVEPWYTPNAMQRYFQLLDDCVAESVPLSKKNWTTAIVLAGRLARHITADQVKRAVETWMQMEQQGHTADHVTFNVLFDLAIKAGRFALADTIYNEMKARDMPFDRYLRASLIYYAGMKADGDGVRKAFRDFVQAGEIVDTVIMNAVIMSLLRAGEAPAAEHVFERMHSLHKEKFGTQSLSDWQDSKEMTRFLNQKAKDLRKKNTQHQSTFFGAPFSIDEQRDEVQRAAPIAPNAGTHIILIKYHAYTSGDADRTWALLDAMRQANFQLTGAVLVFLYRGFHQHGGFAFSAWNFQRLEGLWIQTMQLCTPTPQAIRAFTVQKVDPFEDYDAEDDAQYEDTVDFEIVKNARHPFGVQPSSVNSDGSDDFDLLGAMMSQKPKLSEVLHESRESKSGGGLPFLDSYMDTPAVPGRDKSTHDPMPFESRARYEPPTAEPELPKVLVEKAPFASSRNNSRPRINPFSDIILPAASGSEKIYDFSQSGATVPLNQPDAEARAPVLPPAAKAKIPMTTTLAVAIIRAFYQCSGRRRTLEVWDEMKRALMQYDADVDWNRVQGEVEKCQKHAGRYENQDYDRAR